MENMTRKSKHLIWVWNLYTKNKFEWTHPNKVKFSKLIMEFGVEEIELAMQISLSKKLPLQESFDMIGGICHNKRQNTLRSKILHLKNVLYKIFGTFNEPQINFIVNNAICDLIDMNKSQEQIMDIIEIILIPECYKLQELPDDLLKDYKLSKTLNVFDEMDI